jgi:HlyD family secretion protein
MVRRLGCLIVGLVLASCVASMAADTQSEPKKPEKPGTPKAPAEISRTKAEAKQTPPKKETPKETPKEAQADASKPSSGAEPSKASAPSVAPKSAVKPDGPAANIYTVKRSPVMITVDLDGFFESRKTREILVKPEEWASLRVDEAVPHGARVKEGDVLLKLDSERLDQLIAELQADQRLNEVALRLGEDQLRVAEAMTPLDMELSQRTARMAVEDQTAYFDVERPFYLKMAEFNLKDAANKLEYDEEELRQLEKMYKADDITEETEKIVLKRAQDTVERSKFGVEYNQLSHDQMLKYMIPRMDNKVKETTQRRAIDWEKVKSELPLTIQKQRFDLEKMKLLRDRSADRLKKLMADRACMVVKSPIDGVVYYGKAVRGRFSDATSMADMLRSHGSVQANQVLMTVVEPDDLFIRAAVPETQLHNLHRGLKGKAIPAAYPDLRLGAVVERIDDVPTAPGTFDARLKLTGDDSEVDLTPGMACRVRLTAYLKKEAITVPPKAIVPDELNDQKFYVYVAKADGKSKKISVTVGKRTDKKVEILKGLKEGDQVLLDPPKSN